MNRLNGMGLAVLVAFATFATGCGDEDDSDGTGGTSGTETGGVGTGTGGVGTGTGGVGTGTGGVGTETDACEQLKAIILDCYDTNCATSTSAFCECWNQGMDIDLSCSCVARDMDLACEMVDLELWDGSYDCDAAVTVVEALCI